MVKQIIVLGSIMISSTITCSEFQAKSLSKQNHLVKTSKVFDKINVLNSSKDYGTFTTTPLRPEELDHIQKCWLQLLTMTDDQAFNYFNALKAHYEYSGLNIFLTPGKVYQVKYSLFPKTAAAIALYCLKRGLNT